MVALGASPSATGRSSPRSAQSSDDLPEPTAPAIIVSSPCGKVIARRCSAGGFSFCSSATAGASAAPLPRPRPPLADGVGGAASAGAGAAAAAASVEEVTVAASVADCLAARASLRSAADCGVAVCAPPAKRVNPACFVVS